MVKKYARLLEEWAINDKTGEVWIIDDIPGTWRERTRAKVIEDGFIFNEEGRAIKGLKE